MNETQHSIAEQVRVLSIVESGGWPTQARLWLEWVVVGGVSVFTGEEPLDTFC